MSIFGATCDNLSIFGATCDTNIHIINHEECAHRGRCTPPLYPICDLSNACGGGGAFHFSCFKWYINFMRKNSSLCVYNHLIIRKSHQSCCVTTHLLKWVCITRATSNLFRFKPHPSPLQPVESKSLWYNIWWSKDPPLFTWSDLKQLLFLNQGWRKFVKL